jgi:hypothetical protein
MTKSGWRPLRCPHCDRQNDYAGLSAYVECKNCHEVFEDVDYSVSGDEAEPAETGYGSRLLVLDEQEAEEEAYEDDGEAFEDGAEIESGPTRLGLWLLSVFAIALTGGLIYLTSQLILRDFEPIWQIGLWVLAIVLGFIVLGLNFNIFEAYELEFGDFARGVFFGAVAFACLMVLLFFRPHTTVLGDINTYTTWMILVAVIGGLCGIGLIVANIVQTNLLYGLYISSFQISCSIIAVLLLLALFALMFVFGILATDEQSRERQRRRLYYR